MAMSVYVSEHTKFMQEWLKKHPQELEEKRKGRALWWDKPQSEEVRKAFQQASVPVKSYYYDTDH